MVVTIDSDGEEVDEDEDDFDPKTKARRKELRAELRQLDKTKKKKVPKAQFPVPP